MFCSYISFIIIIIKCFLPDLKKRPAHLKTIFFNVTKLEMSYIYYSGHLSKLDNQGTFLIPFHLLVYKIHTNLYKFIIYTLYVTDREISRKKSIFDLIILFLYICNVFIIDSYCNQSVI